MKWFSYDSPIMQGIAKAFGIECFSTLALLKIMYVRGKAALSDIDRVIDYWEYERDLPTSFAAIKAWRQTLG